MASSSTHTRGRTCESVHFERCFIERVTRNYQRSVDRKWIIANIIVVGGERRHLRDCVNEYIKIYLTISYKADMLSPLVLWSVVV